MFAVQLLRRFTESVFRSLTDSPEFLHATAIVARGTGVYEPPSLPPIGMAIMQSAQSYRPE